MPVHKDNIFRRFGRARVEPVVIEKEGDRCWRKGHVEVGDSAGGVSFFQQKEGTIGPCFIHPTPVQVSIPFITRALCCKPTFCICRALENRSTGGVGAAGSAHVARQDIANPRQGMPGIDRLSWEDFGTGQTLMIFIGVKAGGHPQLPKIVHANRVVGFGLGSSHRRQEQSRKESHDGDHHQ